MTLAAVNETVNLDPRRTLIPIGIFFSVLAVPVLYIGSIMSSRLDKLEESTAQLTAVVTKIDQKFEIQAIQGSDRWSGTDMLVFVARMKAANPTVQVPEIRDLLGDVR